MKSLRLPAAITARSLLHPACARQDKSPENTPTPAVVEVEKSKRDVTICVLAGPMPDVMSTHVKANGKQRVCWKGHGKAYEIYFKTADWPFEEAAPLQPTADLMGLRAPADSAGDFFTLKDRITDTTTRVYPYVILNAAPETNAAPPGSGPEIVGEG